MKQLIPLTDVPYYVATLIGQTVTLQTVRNWANVGAFGVRLETAKMPNGRTATTPGALSSFICASGMIDRQTASVRASTATIRRVMRANRNRQLAQYFSTVKETA